jgi:hypothetical protein
LSIHPKKEFVKIAEKAIGIVDYQNITNKPKRRRLERRKFMPRTTLFNWQMAEQRFVFRKNQFF